MTTFSRRAGRIVPRQVGDTRWHDPSPHVQHWRASNEDDHLRAARGTIAGIAGGVLCWLALAALIAVGVWAIELMAQ
jgi:hypothetical protein